VHAAGAAAVKQEPGDAGDFIETASLNALLLANASEVAALQAALPAAARGNDMNLS
jgi:hypothetical protein